MSNRIEANASNFLPMGGGGLRGTNEYFHRDALEFIPGNTLTVKIFLVKIQNFELARFFQYLPLLIGTQSIPRLNSIYMCAHIPSDSMVLFNSQAVKSGHPFSNN